MNQKTSRSERPTAFDDPATREKALQYLRSICRESKLEWPDVIKCIETPERFTYWSHVPDVLREIWSLLSQESRIAALICGEESSAWNDLAERDM